MAGRNMRVVLMMAVIFAVAVIAGGCGGGTPASKPVVYFDGKLHGDLAAAIAEQADLRAFNDTETDGPVIVSFTEGAPLDASTKAGLKAAYDAGQAVVIEHANESEVRDFLAAIGVSHAYAAPNQDDSARDKDVEIYAVMKTSGDVLVLCIHSDNDCAEGIEKEVTSADYDANEDDEIVSDDDDEEGGEKPTPPLEAEKNAERAKYLFEWIASKEAMASSLSGGKSNAASAAAGAQSAQDDITAIANAWHFESVQDANNWTLRLRYTIYSCHAFATGDDWYFIEQSGNLNPSSAYYKIHVKTDRKGHNDKKIEYNEVGEYAVKYAFENYCNSPDDVADVTLYDHKPLNMNNSETVTNGMSWGGSGSLGFSGIGGNGGLSGSLSYSTSHTRTIQDYNITDNSGGASLGANSKWVYDFRRPSNGKKNAFYRHLNDAPAAARSSFVPVNEWIWKISGAYRDSKLAANDNRVFTSEFSWVSGQTQGACDGIFAVYTRGRVDKDIFSRTDKISVPLPVPPRLVADRYNISFNKKASNANIGILSHYGWTASCDASWCDVHETSGSSTGGTAHPLLIEVGENTTGSARDAHITITDTKGEEKMTITVTQSKTN